MCGSRSSFTKMTKVLKKVCIKAMKKRRHRGRMCIGGPRAYVVIDESKFCHKRKVWKTFKSFFIALHSNQYIKLFYPKKKNEFVFV